MGTGIGDCGFLMAKVRVETWAQVLGTVAFLWQRRGRVIGTGIGDCGFLMAKVKGKTWAWVLGAVASLWQR